MATEEWEYEAKPLPRWSEEDEQDEKAIATECGRKVVFTDGSCLEEADERNGAQAAGCTSHQIIPGI